MPFKTCTSCGEKNGPRSLKCKSCSTEFTTKRSSKNDGANAWNVGKRPDDSKYPNFGEIPSGSNVTNEEIRDLVTDEGIADAVWELVEPNKITDPDLRRLWATAKLAIKDVLLYLYPEHQVV